MAEIPRLHSGDKSQGAASADSALVGECGVAELTRYRFLTFTWLFLGAASGLLTVGSLQLARHHLLPSQGSEGSQSQDNEGSEGADSLAIAVPVSSVSAMPVASASAPSISSDLANSTSSDLANSTQEQRQLERVREAIASRRTKDAVDILNQYYRSFPQGELASEASFLRIEICLKNGNRSEARRLSQSFLRQYPNSPYAARVRSFTFSKAEP